MRKFITAMFLLAFAIEVRADVQILKSSAPQAQATSIACGGTDSSSYGVFTADGSSLVYPIGDATTIVVTVYSDSTSSLVVDIYTAPTSTGPFYNVTPTHITNPTGPLAATGKGEQWNIPRAKFLKIVISSYASGNGHACIGAWNGANTIY